MLPRPIPPSSSPPFHRSAVKSSADCWPSLASSPLAKVPIPIFLSQQQLVAATERAKAIVTVTGQREKDNKRPPNFKCIPISRETRAGKPVVDGPRGYERRGLGYRDRQGTPNCASWPLQHGTQDCNCRQLLPKVKNQSWQHEHQHQQYIAGLSRATTKRVNTNTPRARFDSACCRTHTVPQVTTVAHKNKKKRARFVPFFRAKSLHRWLNLELSHRPKIQSGAKHRAIRTCSSPVSQDKTALNKTHRRSVRIQDHNAKKVRFVQWTVLRKITIQRLLKQIRKSDPVRFQKVKIHNQNESPIAAAIAALPAAESRGIGLPWSSSWQAVDAAGIRLQHCDSLRRSTETQWSRWVPDLDWQKNIWGSKDSKKISL